MCRTRINSSAIIRERYRYIHANINNSLSNAGPVKSRVTGVHKHRSVPVSNHDEFHFLNT